MKKVFILQNQNKEFLSKRNEWVDGRDANALYKTPHKDEAINQKVEASAKDYTQRVCILDCQLNDKKLPVIAPEDLPGLTPDSTAVTTEHSAATSTKDVEAPNTEALDTATLDTEAPCTQVLPTEIQDITAANEDTSPPVNAAEASSAAQSAEGDGSQESIAPAAVPNDAPVANAAEGDLTPTVNNKALRTENLDGNELPHQEVED